MTILKSPPTVPACRLWNSTAENLASSGQNYFLSFDTVRYDNDGMTKPQTSGPSTTQLGSITVRTPGLYLVEGSARFTANVTGRRAAFIIKNGDVSGGVAGFNLQAVTDTGGPTQVTAAGVVNLNTGDQIDLNCNQFSGGALTVASVTGTVTDLSPTLTATWVAGMIVGAVQ